MKKRIFKFGAALTAALMICSATAGLAFAAEADEAAPEAVAPVVEETVDEAAPAEEAAEEVETPAEDAEAPAEDAEDVEAPVEEVAVPLETKDITAEDVAEAAAKVDDVATGSVIAIGDISATADDTYYTVSVPFTVSSAPSQMTLFVYNITGITGDQNNTVGFTAETPVGYINQYAGPAGGSGTYTFKLAKSANNEGDIIVVKIGGTDVATPDAKSFTLTAGGPTPEVTYGDVDNKDGVNATDAILVMQHASGKTTLSADEQLRANVDANDSIDATDAIYIMQYASGKITKFPAEQ